MVGADLLSVFAAFVMLGGVPTGNFSVPVAVGTMFVFTLGALCTALGGVGGNPALAAALVLAAAGLVAQLGFSVALRRS